MTWPVITLVSNEVADINQAMDAIQNVTLSDIPGPLGDSSLAFVQRSANLVWVGPTSGNPAIPTWRALVAADIPSLDGAKITTGTVADARLSTNVALLNSDPQAFAGATTFTKALASIGGVTAVGVGGVPVVVATAQATARSAAIGATNLLSSAPVGTYQVLWYLVTTTVGNAVTVDFKFHHTYNGSAHADTNAVGGSAVAQSGDIQINVANNEASGSSGLFKVDAATIISFETVVSAPLGTGLYAIDVVLLRYI